MIYSHIIGSPTKQTMKLSVFYHGFKYDLGVSFIIQFEVFY